MNLCICANANDEEIVKKSFEQKPVRKDGLVIQIHHTVRYGQTRRVVRFLYSTFNSTGLLTANADIDGNIFIIDLSLNKFWCLPKFYSCSVVAFSPVESTDLITGTNKGDLYILDVHLGTVRGQLDGHNYPVKSISFANELCLTVSRTQAIIFNLKFFSKVHELSIESPTFIKQMFFMPVTNDILACFSDDYIHVWKSRTFTTFKKLMPTDCYKFVIKSIAVTRNGRTMVVAGVSSKLILFCLDSWAVTKILNLPEDITVKNVEFISQTHDGGANRFLILLASNRVVHILDMQQSIFVYTLAVESEVINFASSFNGIHLSCVLSSGEVNIYKLSNFIEPPECDTGCPSTKKKRVSLPALPKHRREDLDLNRLQMILKEFGEYPSTYRALIWSKLLCLPHNKKGFTTIIDKGYHKYFDCLDEKFPMLNKTTLRNLKRLLSNIGNWCPIFCRIEFLPLFVFPFLKVFENEPLMCFEAVVTIIINWCQHWFQYAPCAPINILAMIENMLEEHDHVLLVYLGDQEVTTQSYAWLMLETAFTEILNINNWCILWDHILSNEPAFLLMIPVAYNMIKRNSLASLTNLEEFETFYRQQNPISIKTLINKTYYLLQNTTDENHPRKFLHEFTKLPKNNYPVFTEFSKVVLIDKKEEEQITEEQAIARELQRIEEQTEMYKEAEIERKKNVDIQEEENKRLELMEDLYQERLLRDKERKDQRKLQLSKMRTDLMEMQAEAMENARKKLEEIKLNERIRELDRMMKNIEYDQRQDDIEIQLTEEDLSKHYMELLRQKTSLENMLLQTISDEICSPEKDKNIEKQRKQIKSELDELRKNVTYNRLSQKVTLPLGISIANDRTQNIDMHLARQLGARNMYISASHGTAQIVKMDNDTQELESEVQILLDKFTNAKLKETDYLLNRLTNDATASEKLLLMDRESLEKKKLCCSAPSLNQAKPQKEKHKKRKTGLRKD